MSQFEKKISPDYYRIYPRPTYLLLYKEPKQQYNRRSNLLSKRSSTSNTLSRNSAMKMRRALSWLVASAEKKKVYEKRYKRKVDWRINFITLTLPIQNDVTDARVKRMFNTWCKWAKYNCGLSNYVWKAEVQKRGELHLHVITDCYIHYSNLNFAWNRILKKEGLLNGHIKPNSTDVHAVLEDDVKDLTAYVVDYMQKKGKNEEGEVVREIKGRLWGCSRALSKAGKDFQTIDEDEAQNLSQAFMKHGWQEKQVDRMPVWMYFIKGRKDIYNFIDKEDEIHRIYSNELELIRSNQVQLSLFERMATITVGT